MLASMSVVVALLLAVSVGGMASYAYRRGGWAPSAFASAGIVGVVAATWSLDDNWWRLISGVVVVGTLLAVNALSGEHRAPERVS